MILVDTSVIVTFWKKPKDRWRQVFLEEEVAICGIVKAELMHGAQDERTLSIIVEALSEFVYVPIDETVWEDVGRLLYRLRRKGIAVPFQDVVLCALSLRHNMPIWTEDKHFELIKSEVKELQLFRPGDCLQESK